MQAKILALIHAPLQSAAKAQDDFVFLRDDSRQINADVRGIDAPARRVLGVVGDLCAMHHGFRRRAPDVDACSPQILFLDERDRPPQIRETERERIAGLA